MRKSILTAVAAVGLCILISGPASAQGGSYSGSPGKHGGQGDHGNAAALTDAQKASVTLILSKYSPSSLTAADAKEIHRSFRETGIHKGPGLRAAIQSAGFDPEKLRQLDPPPDRKERGEEGSNDSMHGRKGGGSGKKQKN